MAGDSRTRAMKPIPSIPKALRTVDVLTGESAQAINQRSDSTAVPAASVVAEAMVRLTLAKYALDKFGGDSVAETRRNLSRISLVAGAHALNEGVWFRDDCRGTISNCTHQSSRGFVDYDRTPPRRHHRHDGSRQNTCR